MGQQAIPTPRVLQPRGPYNVPAVPKKRMMFREHGSLEFSRRAVRKEP